MFDALVWQFAVGVSYVLSLPVCSAMSMWGFHFRWREFCKFPGSEPILWWRWHLFIGLQFFECVSVADAFWRSEKTPEASFLFSHIFFGMELQSWATAKLIDFFFLKLCWRSEIRVCIFRICCRLLVYNFFKVLRQNRQDRDWTVVFK